MTSRRNFNINSEAVYAAAINRDYEEAQKLAEEQNKPTTDTDKPTTIFSTKFKNTASSNSSRQTLDYHPAVVGKKSQSFASEIEARIASNKLQEMIREAAMRRMVNNK